MQCKLFYYFSSLDNKYREDKLERKHINFPRTGPVIIFNQKAMFHHQTMEPHANYFLPLMGKAVKNGRTCIICVVDNGPDMNLTNYINEMYIGRLCLDSGADIIGFTSYTAGQSTYSMPGHL